MWDDEPILTLPWKEALDKYLPQFFAFFHPNINDDIDWSYPSRHLDKELRKLASDSRTSQKVTDSLVEVRRHGGETVVRSMFHAGLSAPDIRAFFRLVDWIMTLSPDQDESFYDDLHDLERSQNMPYITSIERRGIAKGLEQGLEQGREQGLEQGREQGLRSAALLALESRFGPVSEVTISTIQAISNKDQLIALVGAIACADSLETAIEAINAASNETW